MKCIYFLTPTLATTNQVSADLHDVGVNDFYLHVICRDHAGLKRHQIHSSNYFETLDVVRDGFLGAAPLTVGGPSQKPVVEAAPPAHCATLS